MICHSQGEVLFSSLRDPLYNNPGEWQFYKCSDPDCKHIWLNPAPEQNEIWKIYDEYYTHSDKGNLLKKMLAPLAGIYYQLKYGYGKNNILKKLPGVFMYLAPTEKVEFDYDILYLKSTENNKLLDIGCGNGDLISRLQQKGWDTEGTEIDSKSVELCIERNLKVRQGEVTEMNLVNNSYDVITINHVIEHHYDPRLLVSRSFELLKNKGRLIVVTPNTGGLSFRFFGTSWFALQPPGHLNLFNSGNLMRMATEQGFREVFSRTTARNEYWIYYASRIIGKKGKFDADSETKSYSRLILGKLYQLFILFILIFNRKAGGEVVLTAVK